MAVDDADNINQLSQTAQQAGSTLNVVVEVDVGMERYGVLPGEPALDLARLVCERPGLKFEGLLGYEGHAVFIKDRVVRRETVHMSMGKLVRTAERIRESGINVHTISAGGTGTYDLTGIYPGVTEVEAGSYVLMDTYYRSIGLDFRCALTIFATVISAPAPRKAIIDAGL